MRATGSLIAVLALLLVPAWPAHAEVIDLTAEGSQAWIGWTCFSQFDPNNSTGTGVIDPFLQIQGPSSGSVERGYNTTGTLEYDTKYAEAIQIEDLLEIVVDEVSYYEFLLDVDEAGGRKSLVSLDEVRIYLADVSSLDDSQFGAPIYDMDAGGDRTILLDASLVGPGSGSGDMVMLVPTEFFGNDRTKYVYLYSSLGGYTPAEAGFEEWAVRGGGGPSAIPEPATLALLASGCILLRCRRG